MNHSLRTSAKEAFRGYVRSYKAHRMRKVYDVTKLDLKAVGKSFGFTVPPLVHI